MAAIELYSTPLYTDINLVAYYRLESDGTDSKNSYPLTANGTVTFGTGEFGNAASFGTSGNSNSLRTTNTIGINGGVVSFVAWVKKNANLASGKYSQAIYQCNNSSMIEYRLGIDDASGTEKVDFTRGKIGVADNNAQIAETWNVGDWHHLAGTYDGTNVLLYFDGTQVATTTSTGNGSNSSVYSNGLSLGNNNNNSSFIQNAFTVDDAAIFNRVLTATEISNLYTGNWPVSFISRPNHTPLQAVNRASTY